MSNRVLQVTLHLDGRLKIITDTGATFEFGSRDGRKIAKKLGVPEGSVKQRLVVNEKIWDELGRSSFRTG